MKTGKAAAAPGRWTLATRGRLLGQRMLLFGMVACVLSVGCRGGDGVSELEVHRPMPNIVIFLIDTLRADRLGVYGFDELPTSPRIDRLASESVVFDQAYAPAPWTLPSLASMFTSTFICEHNTINDRNRLPDSLVTMGEHLQSLEYQTYGLFGNAYAGKDFGMSRGITESRSSVRNDGTKVVEILGSQPSEPFFLYIHNVEPHGGERFRGRPRVGFPEVSKELREEMMVQFEHYRHLTRVDYVHGQTLGSADNTDEQRSTMDNLNAHLESNWALYDAAVQLADERVGSVIDQLVEWGIWDDTLFLVVADHGEELDDHGGWQHDQSVYEELVRVPMIVKFPAGRWAGTRVEDPVSLVDVMPTILDYLDRPKLAVGARGKSLLPVIRGETDSEPKVVSVRINRKKYFRPWKESRGDVNIAIRYGSYKGIWNAELGHIELYDLDLDPDERTDVSQEEIEVAAMLERFAGEWLADCGAQDLEVSSANLSDETKEQLRSLGYLD